MSVLAEVTFTPASNSSGDTYPASEPAAWPTILSFGATRRIPASILGENQVVTIPSAPARNSRQRSRVPSKRVKPGIAIS